MLWQRDRLVSAHADECESQYVLHSELARNLAGLELKIEMVTSPASEVVTVEPDLVAVAFEPRRVAARIALRRAEAAVTAHCNPGDQLSTPEWRLMVKLVRAVML